MTTNARSRAHYSSKGDAKSPVFVLDIDGNPMDPTMRFGKVRHMLKDGRAKCVCRKPFTIQLQYVTKTHVTKQYAGGTDPGRENIGNAVITENGECVYADHVSTDNKSVTKHMSERKTHRSASRRGERKRRKRRAKKAETTKKFPNGRTLPGCDEPVMLKDITNTEAKFNNRKRPAGWLTPTVRNLVDTTLHQVDGIRSILPVTDWTIEANKFAFMRMEDNTIQGVDFQNGRLKGYANTNEYVSELQGHHCLFCDAKIDHFHHIVPRSKGGSDTPENLVGLCTEHHTEVHTEKLDLTRIGFKKKYAHLSVLNQAIPYIISGLIERFGKDHVHLVEGYNTKEYREAMDLPKEHYADAIAIAGLGIGAEAVHAPDTVYEVQRFRRQNRAIINSQRERTYKLDGTTVAKNRKPRFEQKDNALSDWYESRVNEVGAEQANRERSNLTVTKSKRHYNTKTRIMPGATFLYKGTRYVLSGQFSHGQYYRVVGQGTKYFPAKNCRILTHNTGLVYL